MNIEQYIDSGIVELYATGMASPEQAGEFESLLPQYPQLQESLLEFELLLERQALENQVAPPDYIRRQVLLRINEIPVIKRPEEYAREEFHQHSSRKEADYIAASVSSEYIKVHKNWRTAMIVLFIFSKIFLAFGIYFFVQYQRARQEVFELKHVRQQETIQQATVPVQPTAHTTTPLK